MQATDWETEAETETYLYKYKDKDMDAERDIQREADEKGQKTPSSSPSSFSTIKEDWTYFVISPSSSTRLVLRWRWILQLPHVVVDGHIVLSTQKQWPPSDSSSLNKDHWHFIIIPLSRVLEGALYKYSSPDWFTRRKVKHASNVLVRCLYIPLYLQWQQTNRILQLSI